MGGMLNQLARELRGLIEDADLEGLERVLSFRGGRFVYIKADELAKHTPPPGAVTATADGLTTGLIPADATFVSITSGNADHIVTLPAVADLKVGHKIEGWVGANGCELRTPASGNTKINNIDSDGTNEAAIPATTLIRLQYVGADGWVLQALTELGAVITAIVPDTA